MRAARLLELAALRASVPTRPILSDTILPAASDAALGSKLWLGAATALALAGGTSERRASAEGAIAVGVASALVNGALKQAIRGPRPRDGVGRFLVPGRGSSPSTSSMPSSHAAAAGAMTVAASLCAPWTAGPLGLATAVVAWSRVSNGRHFPSDVVVGFGVGAAAGLAVHRIALRVAPPEDAST